MKNVLIHLHPDFSDELRVILERWNSVQSVLQFHGITPPENLESNLLMGGAEQADKIIKTANSIRIETGYSAGDEIIVFTEKRIYWENYYQLYLAGVGNTQAISLDFTRSLFAESNDRQGYIFRALLNNVLSALSMSAGLNSHDDTRGCVMDFCNNMPDIIKGIEGGPRYCKDHLDEIQRKKKHYLLDLVQAISSSKEIAKQDTKISRRITSFDNPFDIGIVIALQEEFREFFSLIDRRPKPSFNDEINQYYYVFDRASNPYRCVVTFIGKMNTDNAALVSDRLMQQFKPATVINIGIAGSMDKDVWAGDVVVAEQVEKHLDSAKAIDGKATFEFLLSGDSYKSSPEYVTHARNLEFAYPNNFEGYKEDCLTRIKATTGDNIIKLLKSNKIIKEFPIIHTGSIASGPIVGSSSIFVDWLKNHADRKYIAIEMEAGGMMNAAYSRRTKTLVIRGISDFSNSKKAEFDQIDGGVLRKYAMINAVLLLWTMMDLDFLARSSDDVIP